MTSTHTEVIRSIERICGEIRREIGAPPSGAKKEAWKALSYIFNLESDHHKRPSGGRGQMYSDVVAFLSLVNDNLTDAAWTHWCWDEQRGKPCCESEADTQRKTAVVAVNLFVSSGFAVGSLARFTHTSMCLNKLIAGRVCKRILPRALQFGRAITEWKEPERLRAEEVGSGLSDMATTTSVRKRRVAEWMIAEETHFVLPCLKLVTNRLDEFEYALFGHRGRRGATDARPHFQVTITFLVDPGLSPIVKVLAEMWSLLSDWSPRPESPWFLLPMCGVKDFDKEALRRTARRQVSVGHAQQEGTTPSSTLPRPDPTRAGPAFREALS